MIATTKHLCIALNAALAQVLLFAAFVVWRTGNTDELVAVGQMSALVIDAVGQVAALVIEAVVP